MNCLRIILASFMLLISRPAIAVNLDSIHHLYDSLTMDHGKFGYGQYLFFQHVYSNKENALKIANELIEHCKHYHRTAFMAQAYNFKGIYYDVTSNRDSALILYRKALKTIDGHDSLISLKASYYNNIGLVHMANRRNDSAFYYYNKALEVPQEKPNLKFEGNIIHNIGIALNRQEMYDKALEYLKRGVAIGIERKDDRYLGQIYQTIGENHWFRGRQDSAMLYFNRAKPMFEKAGDRFRLAMVYHDIASLLQLASQRDSAVILYKKSYAIKKALNDQNRMASSANKIAEVYYELGNADSARKYIDLAEKYIDSTELSRYSIFLQVRAKVEMLENNHTAAIQTLKNVIILKDSFHQRNFRTEVAEMQEQLDVKLKNAEISRLASDKKRLESEALLYHEKRRNQQLWIVGLAILALLLIAIGWVLLNRTKLKNQSLLTQRELQFQEKLNNAMIDAQEEERQRIAQDLHDDIGQQITAIKIGWSNFTRENQLGQKGEHIQTSLNDLAGNVRQLSHAMMPKALNQLGLAAALEDLCQRLATYSQLQVEFDSFNLKDRYDGLIEKSLYRIAQEALNNCVKHSNASQVAVQLYGKGQYLHLMIEDNGNGMKHQEHAAGRGFFNMQSRIKMLNGELNIETSESKGTLIFVKVPKHLPTKVNKKG